MSSCCNIEIWTKRPTFSPPSNGAAKSTKKAGIIFINERESKKILFVQNYGSKWSFPKGSVEVGETFVDAAIREAKEETGIEIDKKKIHEVLTLRNKQFFIYREHVNYNTARIFDRAEITGIGWLCRECLNKIQTSKTTSDIAKQCFGL
jgi:8-oxo-dGTP pyrophosphatase MutT (NUDIX family)